MLDWGTLGTWGIIILSIAGGVATAMWRIHKILHTEITLQWEKVDLIREEIAALRKEMYTDFTRTNDFRREMDEVKVLLRETVGGVSQLREMLITHWAKQRDDGK